jgi:hypothetical protein
LVFESSGTECVWTLTSWSCSIVGHLVLQFWSGKEQSEK